MFYAMTWLLIAGLLLLWSATAWALHKLAQWAAAHNGGLTGLGDQIGSIKATEWLAPWLPQGAADSLTELMSALTPLIESLLAYAPGLLSWLAPAIWAIWLAGSLLLFVLGGILSVVIRVFKSRMLTPVMA